MCRANVNLGLNRFFSQLLLLGLSEKVGFKTMPKSRLRTVKTMLSSFLSPFLFVGLCYLCSKFSPKSNLSTARPKCLNKDPTPRSFLTFRTSSCKNPNQDCAMSSKFCSNAT